MTTTAPDVLGSLTVLIQAIRPEWDTRAIRPVLQQLLAAERRDLADLAHAAIRTAQDPAMRRPTAISFDSDHWRPTVRPTETEAERTARIQAQIDQRRETAEHNQRVADRLAASEHYREQARVAIEEARLRKIHTNQEQETNA